jgi:phospholipid/cholesterol/gamma-HCH transport system permease protein
LGFGDVLHGLTKSVVFGVVIGLSSCHFGITTSGGAPGVGRSVHTTVVVSAAGIFGLDYLLSFVLQ